VAVSLRTRHFREAEHRAALVDGAFDGASARARAAVSGGAQDLNAILRGYLREALEAQDSNDGMGPMPVSSWPLRELEAGLADTQDALAARDPRNVRAIVDRLMDRHGLPETERKRLGIGVLEAEVRLFQRAIRRARGEEATVFTDPDEDDDVPRASASPIPQPPPSPAPPSKPRASSLVEPFFVRREKRDNSTFKQVHMERTTLRLFLEVCGDKPVDAYHRGDVTRFLDTLRRLPNTYGKSPKDKDRSVKDIIVEADGAEKARLTDRTVQRHLTALSQFLQFAVDGGHLTIAGRAELVDGHRFREERGAREQRDVFTPEELTKLFASPVWRGRHAFFRDKAGPQVIRDAYFWLPLLALYHGARLEELADLRRRDVGRDGGTWFLNITDEGEGHRRLKNGNARRVVPLHPEVVRLGFLADVEKMAPRPDDPLFPELPPRGKDQRRGVDVTKWFTRYRRKFGLDRPGLSFHSFRHTAITRLSDLITDFQQKRHRDRIMGHAGGAGGEGDVRYDKGPGLKAAAATLALLQYPEVNLSQSHDADRKAPEGEAQSVT
jgi:integrase